MPCPTAEFTQPCALTLPLARTALQLFALGVLCGLLMAWDGDYTGKAGLEHLPARACTPHGLLAPGSTPLALR